MKKIRDEKLFSVLVAIWILILPLWAGADTVPWSTHQYKAWAWGLNYGEWNIASGTLAPVSAHVDFNDSYSSGTFTEYAESEITASTMYVGAQSHDYPAHASSAAGFTGTYTASLPFFVFSYEYDPEGIEGWITVQDATTSATLLSQAFEGSRTLTIATPVQDEIRVDFWLRADTGVDQSGASDLRSGSLTYSMSVAPEPAGPVLFLAGGTVVVCGLYVRRGKNS
ncbi:MAG: hypothetical protein HZA16_16010 [Nitrospirae bacterium]|nr:hypothetical protein [Nitrospirota bacterium]